MIFEDFCGLFLTLLSYYFLDEIMERCSLSPPPALDHSSITLTKLPPAIKNLKKMLQQDGDSEEEQDNTNYVNSSPHRFRKTLSELQKLFRKNPSSHITDVQEVPNDRSRDPHMSHPDMPKNNQLKTTEGRNESSQKENGVDFKQRSVSRNKSSENYKHGNNVKKTGESSDGVLTEVRENTVSKQRTLISMLGNSLNREAKKTIQTSKPSPCFVITRLPKQFVVSYCKCKVTFSNIGVLKRVIELLSTLARLIIFFHRWKDQAFSL